MAQVICIDSVSKSAARDSANADVLAGFRKALEAVKSLNRCSMPETQTALANWQASGMLSPEEHAALMSFYGWGSA